MSTAGAVVTSTRTRRWVWAAMEPGERLQVLDQVRRWVDWLTMTFPEETAARLPPCWYQHPGALERITALYVAWVRIYVEVGDQQRELALVEWHDALDRHLTRIGVPRVCLQEGHHAHQPLPAPSGDAAEAQWVSWRTSAWMKAPARHPAPGRVAAPSRPKTPVPGTIVTSAEMQAHVAAGNAELLAGLPVARYATRWWLADGDQYVCADAEGSAKIERMAERRRGLAALVEQIAQESRSSGTQGEGGER